MCIAITLTSIKHHNSSYIHPQNLYIVKPHQKVKFMSYMFESTVGPFNLLPNLLGKMAAFLI